MEGALSPEVDEEFKKEIEIARKIIEDPLFTRVGEFALNLGKKYFSRMAHWGIKKIITQGPTLERGYQLLEELAPEESKKMISRVKDAIEGCYVVSEFVPGQKYNLYTLNLIIEDVALGDTQVIDPRKAREKHPFLKGFIDYDRKNEEHAQMARKYDRIIKFNNFHDFLSLDYGRGFRDNLLEVFKSMESTSRRKKSIAFHKSLVEGIDEIHKKMFEVEDSYERRHNDLESLVTKKSERLLEEAKKGKTVIRVAVTNLEFEERNKAGLDELTDYDSEKKTWFVCALSLRREESVLPLFELREKVRQYMNKTGKRDIGIKVEKEKINKYPESRHVIERGSRELYSKMKEGDRYDVIFKRAIVALPEKNRYHLGKERMKVLPLLKLGAKKEKVKLPLEEKEREIIVIKEADKKRLEKVIDELHRYNNRLVYHQVELELRKINLN